ncbi:hypothetical protein GCM10011514_42710 [Emticicia aquatilis]|uniref:Uncharacterized protein n=1 Tax=Emticicia aquatilis TaxID=1537369 RepID=A0A917DV47_9BACT|nr:hypothetical protein [Emticicia aquatilis]GGD74079.1 hypothetical protein GCM10011514_42710 [Emticicia aquatilis]
MKKVYFLLFMALAACQSKKTETASSDSTTVSADTVATTTATVAEETVCYEFRFKKDVTSVKLIMKGDSVRGEMSELLWEKDSATGTLKGKKVGNDLIVDYDYVIEGSNQVEERILRMEGDKLLVMSGELMEDKSGKLKMKDPAKATVSETLVKVKCQ